MSLWPDLTAARDRPTIVALHYFAQVLGKVPTALLPWRNHGWQLTLHVRPRGLSTEPIYAPPGVFTLALDLAGHEVVYEDSHRRLSAPLGPMAVADFYASFLRLLAEAGHDIHIHAAPNEVEPAIPFAEDHEPRTYDRDSAARLLGALHNTDRVFRLFRSSFLGKASPVQFFWGSFDLAVTRFSGRTAPRHPGGIPHLPDAVTREAYSHEESSAGFWPGGAGAEGGPFFYSYAYPSPEGFAEAAIGPEAARWNSALGEYVLDYVAVQGAPDPDAALLAFLTSTYEAAATLGKWDRPALECAPGRPGVPRQV